MLNCIGYLCASLSPIVTVLALSKVKEITGPFNLLESQVLPLILLVSAQELTDKTIYLKNRYDVHVDDWRISFTIDRAKAFNFEYIWEVLEGNKTWAHITKAAPIETLIFKKRCDGNDGEMIFKNKNPANVRAKYWRVKITAGEFQRDFCVNQIYMTLSS